MRWTRFSIARLMGLVLFFALGLGGLKAANPLWASLCYTLAFVVLVAGVIIAIQTRGAKRAFWVGFSVSGWVYFVFGFVFPYGAGYETPPQFFPSALLEEGYALFFPVPPSTVTVTYNPLTTNVVTPPMLGGSPTPTIPPAISPPMPAPIATPTPTLPPPVLDPSIPPPLPVTANVLPTTTFTNATLSSSTFTMNANGTITPVPLSTMESLASFNHVGQSIITLVFAGLGGWFSRFLFSRRERNEAIATANLSPSSP